MKNAEKNEPSLTSVNQAVLEISHSKVKNLHHGNCKKVEVQYGFCACAVVASTDSVLPSTVAHWGAVVKGPLCRSVLGESGRIRAPHWSPSRHRIDNREPQSPLRVNRVGTVHCPVEVPLHFASPRAT